MIIKHFIKAILPRSLLDVIRALRRIQNQKKALDINVRAIKALLNGSVPIKLELGAGNRKMEGWTSVDLHGNCSLSLDLTKPIPFPDNSVSMIYSSHLLEHFEYSELIKLLAECLRILKPGSSFSACIPNARIYLNAYHDAKSFAPAIYCRYEPAYNFNSPIDYVNYMAYMAGHHKYMFDEENIVAILNKAGFRSAKLRAIDKSLDLEDRDFQSIYISADK